MVDSNNVDLAARHLQRRFVFLKRCSLALEFCFWGLVTALVFTVFTMLSGWSIPLLYVYGAIALCWLLGFLIVAWRTHIPVLVVLQQADRVQHFQERLSTAHEYLAQHSNNPFVPGLVREAERSARQVNPRLVFPLHWSSRFWAVPLCLAALIAVSSLDLKPISFEDLGSEETSPDVSREGKRIEQWGQHLEELAKQQQLDRSLILARHMQNLGRRLQQEGGKNPEAAQRISTLSQYLQRMQQELHERALMANTGGMSAQDVMISGKSLKQELQDILKLLQSDELPREMAAVAEQGVRRLSQHMGANPDLERLAQSLRAGNLKAARQLLQDIIQQQQASEELEHLERARRALEYSSRSIQQGGEAQQSTSQGTPQSGDQIADDAPLEFDDEESEDMPASEDDAARGLDEGVGAARHSRSGGPNELRESSLPPSRVRVKQGEGDMRLAYIRRLPMHNEAQMPMEEIVVRYQQQAEDVLSQEHIPRNYREQIKQYFLAIGMISSNNP